MLSNNKIRYTILFLIAFTAIVSVFVSGPIYQDQQYHLFADEREILCIPNFLNVISNIPLLIIGVLGMFFIIQNNKENNVKLWMNSLVFFIGIFFTGAGSMYYHLHPGDQTLLWDRLPMTISFMAFFSVVISKFICARSGARILIPLLIIGFISIVYWQMTERRGEGDLRFYALVQFLPLLLISVILLVFKANNSLKKYFWIILFTYALAKIFEMCDLLIFDITQCISGHSIKHILAAMGPAIYLLALNKKSPLLKNYLR
ncbi:MAG: ceramidase domain-containing protein [Bacteroidia bacterium]|nr:ceramidase domain-containing protein [Bacteroidia bacterium]